jgi:flagellar L-ring protein FlgH
MSNVRGLLFLLLAFAGIDAAQAQAPAPVEADSQPRASFYADRRAVAKGDVLTVVITEFSTVAATARTQTNKGESARASITQPNAVTQSVGASFDTQFAGGGEIERSGKLVANLAVTVTGVDPRGNLIVHGEQEIHVNNERQRISLNGVIRPEDIAPDNTIPSWRVGDAHIEFTGKGLLARKQKPGLLSRILSLFGE